MKPHILAWVEDPGAANMLHGLTSACHDHSVSLTILASPFAQTHLASSDEVAIAGPAVRDREDAQRVIARHRPTALLAGTSEEPESGAFPLIEVARERGIPSVGVVDATTNAAERFRGRGTDPLTHLPDIVAVPDDETAQAFRQLGIDPRRILTIGHPRHAVVRQRRAILDDEGVESVRARLWPELIGGGPIIVFAAEVSTGLRPTEFRRTPEYTLRGRSGSHERTAIVAEEILDAAKAMRSDIQILARLHPKNTRSDLVTVDDHLAGVSEGGDPLEVWYAADLVIGMSSMALVEARLLGVPTISCLPREAERRWVPAAYDGPVVTTQQTLRQAIHRALHTPRRPPTAEKEEPTSERLLTTLIQQEGAHVRAAQR